MKNIIDFTEKELKILSYEEDIKKLTEMIRIYEKTENLNGGFYMDMVSEIRSQIIHCENCIKNLQDFENV